MVSIKFSKINELYVVFLKLWKDPNLTFNLKVVFTLQLTLKQNLSLLILDRLEQLEILPNLLLCAKIV